VFGVAGFVDFSAKGWREWGLVIGLDFRRRFCGLFRRFFDIVDGRKRSAGGGALRFGWFGAFGCRAVRTKERWLCFKRATRFGLGPLTFGLAGFGSESAVTRQCSDRPVACRLRLAGHWG
jgi:hypothetical protein